MSDAIRQTTFEDYRGRWAADDRRSALKTALERRLKGGVGSEKGRERKVDVVAMEPIRMHLAAGRERVFAAWTEPALLVRWWGPGAEADLDLRIGGRFRLSMQFDWGAMVAVGEYREIVEPERLVFTFSWDGDPTGEETLVTLVLREAEGGTETDLSPRRLRRSGGRGESSRRLAGLCGAASGSGAGSGAGDRQRMNRQPPSALHREAREPLTAPESRGASPKSDHGRAAAGEYDKQGGKRECKRSSTRP